MNTNTRSVSAIGVFWLLLQFFLAGLQIAFAQARTAFIPEGVEFRKASFRVIAENGSILAVAIDDSGSGYLPYENPIAQINDAAGTGANLRFVINEVGGVESVTVVNGGAGYINPEMVVNSPRMRAYPRVLSVSPRSAPTGGLVRIEGINLSDGILRPGVFFGKEKSAVTEFSETHIVTVVPQWVDASCPIIVKNHNGNVWITTDRFNRASGKLRYFGYPNNVPTNDPGLYKAIGAGQGKNHIITLTAQDEVAGFGFGKDFSGDPSLGQIKLPKFTNAVDVFASEWSSSVLKVDGTCQAFGVSGAVPFPEKNLRNVAILGVGFDSGMAVLNNGDVFPYRAGSVSAVGGSPIASNIIQICASRSHFALLSAEGGVIDKSTAKVPELVLPVKQIQVGDGFTCALSESGAVKIWGNKSFYVPKYSNSVVRIAAGADHLVVQDSNSKLYTHGRNDNKLAPPAMFESEVLQITCGGWNTVVLVSALPEMTRLMLLPSVGGLVANSPNKDNYDRGDIVTLTANALEGFEFVGWIGDLDGFANPERLLMSTNRVVGALFRDWQIPLLYWSSPSPGPTSVDSVVMAGRVTDNAPGVGASWGRDGVMQGSLSLSSDGAFRIDGLKLMSGTNRFSVTVRDAAGNEATADRVVVLGPACSLRQVPFGVNGVLAFDLEAPSGDLVILETTIDFESWVEVSRSTGLGAGKPFRVMLDLDPNAHSRFWRARVP